MKSMIDKSSKYVFSFDRQVISYCNILEDFFSPVNLF